MNEMSIVHEIAKTISKYEEEVLFDVESYNHEYILKYDEANENMFLQIKESYYTKTTKWVFNYTTIERYNITPTMYANISIIILRDHVLITKGRYGIMNNKHIPKIHPQLITPI